MNLDSIASLKSGAVEEFLAGNLTGADMAWSRLESHFVRHDVEEGVFAVTFNRLLVALEAGERAEAQRLMGLVAERFTGDVRQTPVLHSVADEISKLFETPYPGIDHEQSDALYELARPYADVPNPSERGQRGTRAYESPAALALCPPDVSLVLLFRLAEGARTDRGAPAWVRRLSEAFRFMTEREPELVVILDEQLTYLEQHDRLRGYRRLVDAFVWSAENNPRIAAELSLGLAILERDGLPKKLDYAPNPPQEARYESLAVLHGRVARVLTGCVDADELALVHWKAMLEFSERRKHLVEKRHERGGRRAADPEQEAELAVWRCRALVALGEHDAAEAAIEHCVQLAERRAYARPGTAAKVLGTGGWLAERRGNQPKALEHYRSLRAICLPDVSGPNRLRSLMEAIETVREEEQALLHIAQGLAGLIRVDAVGHALQVELADNFLALSSGVMNSRDAAMAQLWVGLAAAMHGALQGATAALEAGMLLDWPEAICLASLFRGRILVASDDGDASDGLQHLAHAATLIRALGKTVLRRRLELSCAELYQRYGATQDAARVEIQLRRVAESLEAGTPVGLPSPLEVNLPGRVGHLELILRRLVQDEKGALALRMSHAMEHSVTISTVASELENSEEVAESLRTGFMQRYWGRDADAIVPIPTLQLRVWSPSEVTPVQAESYRPMRGECFIHFRRYEQWSLAFIRVGRQTVAVELPPTSLGLKAGVGEAIVAAITPLMKSIEVAYVCMPAPGDDDMQLLTGCIAGLEPYIPLVTVVNEVPQGWTGFTPLPTATKRILVVGDYATSQDLRLAELAGSGGYSMVEFVHGAMVESERLGEVIIRGDVIYLVGGIEGLSLELADGGPPMGVECLGRILAGGEVSHVVLLDTVGSLDTDCFAKALAPYVQGGVIFGAAGVDPDRTVVQSFLRASASSRSIAQLAESVHLAVGHCADGAPAALRYFTAF